MPQIVAQDLEKSYFVAERRPGLAGAALGLVRRHREIRALDRVSFEIERGELVGYIGPNGAGKSTTVKVLSGIFVPDRGTCIVDGRVPWKERIRHVAHIGVVFGQRSQLWWDLPVIESFDLLRDIYRVPEVDYRRRREEMIGLLDLSPLLDVPVRQLSLGQKMRCELAAALLHTPDILFLDEPTIGLDAVAKLAVRDFVKRLNSEYGMTVILTTHDMDDIEELCRRVMVISQGRVLCDGTLADLRRRVTRERRLIVDLEDADASIVDEQATVVRRDGHRVHVTFDPAQVTTAELISRLTKRHAVRDLFVEEAPIEEIIARLYAQEKDARVTPYLATMSARFRTLLQYRAAALAGFATQLFWGFLKIMVLEAFYASATTTPPMTFREVASYVWLGQAMLTMLPWNIDSEIRQMVKTGGLVYELLRPVDVYGLWYARTLALRTAPMILRAVPMFFFAGLVLPLMNPAWGLAPPPSIASALAWVCSTGCALLLGCALTALMQATLPFTIAAEGVVRFVPALVIVCSGLIAPLPLFPDWVQPILNALPFRWLADMPYRIYSGHVGPIDGLRGCAIQLAWTAGFLLAGPWILGRGLRRAELFGG